MRTASIARTTLARVARHDVVGVRAMSGADDLVLLDYKELLEPTEALLAKIEKAYSYDGLGILAVANIPEYAEKRAELLPVAKKFADLPEDVKAKYEHPESYYSFGWSHGKEQLEGKPDFSKGSFYNNPQYDRPVDDEELIKKFPAFCHPNIWPSDIMPELETGFKGLGRLICSVGEMVAAQCDLLVQASLPAYKTGYLEEIVRTSRCAKGRLLYYFPDAVDEATDTEGNVSSWCGWHNDHGSLTGLANAMYLTPDGEEVACPDDKAGLYIKSRRGEVVRVVTPKNCLAFQIGEAAQIHSGGVLQATPHCVRAAATNPEISRATFAVFMEPEWHESMATPSGADDSRVLRGAQGELLPPGVPPLASRWEPSFDFGQFSDKTLESYY